MDTYGTQSQKAPLDQVPGAMPAMPGLTSMPTGAMGSDIGIASKASPPYARAARNTGIVALFLIGTGPAALILGLVSLLLAWAAFSRVRASQGRFAVDGNLTVGAILGALTSFAGLVGTLASLAS